MIYFRAIFFLLSPCVCFLNGLVNAFDYSIYDPRYACRDDERCTYLSKCKNNNYSGRRRFCITQKFVGICCSDKNLVIERVLDSVKTRTFKRNNGKKQTKEGTEKTYGGSRKGVQYHSGTRKVSTTTERPSKEEGCGQRKMSSIRSRQKRIVNGTETKFGEFPWQVLIVLKTENCGGAILNANWVITAAHCVYQDEEHDLSVIVGEHDSRKETEILPRTVKKVDKIIMHPMFDSLTYEYDISLLKLKDSITFASHIQPICLPDEGSDHYGRYGVVTGWGMTVPEGQAAEVLQKVSLPIIDNESCERMYRNSGREEDIPSIFFCAGFRKGLRDSCNGDSGGPLQLQENGRFYLIGVMSWGIGCAEPNKPGVYIKVSEFISWINDVMKDN